MSVLGKFFNGFGFRSAYPVFEPGQEISAFMTGYDEQTDTGIVRVGDTVLELPDARPNLVGQELRLRVTDFDHDDHRGRAEMVNG